MADSIVTPLRPKRPCPECSRPSQRATFPFCSVRCKETDLNRWLSGAYAIPVRDDEEDEEAAEPQMPASSRPGPRSLD